VAAAAAVTAAAKVTATAAEMAAAEMTATGSGAAKVATAAEMVSAVMAMAEAASPPIPAVRTAPTRAVVPGVATPAPPGTAPSGSVPAVLTAAVEVALEAGFSEQAPSSFARPCVSCCRTRHERRGEQRRGVWVETVLGALLNWVEKPCAARTYG